jgi:hypothetical protein
MEMDALRENLDQDFVEIPANFKKRSSISEKYAFLGNFGNKRRKSFSELENRSKNKSKRRAVQEEEEISESSDESDIILTRPFKSLRIERNSHPLLSLGGDILGVVLSFCWTDYPRIAQVSKFFLKKNLEESIKKAAQLTIRYPSSSRMKGLKINFSLSNCCKLYIKRNLSYAVHLGMIGVIKALNPNEKELEQVMFLSAEEGQLEVLRFVTEELNAPIHLFQTEKANGIVIQDEYITKYIEKSLGIVKNAAVYVSPFASMFPDEIIKGLLGDSDDEMS